MTHIQRQIQTQHITLPQQLLKIPILGLALGLQFGTQPRPVVILNFHAKSQRLLGHIPPDAPHPQHAQHLALRIVPQRRQCAGLAPPPALAQAVRAHGQVPQRAQQQEHADVGGGIVDGRGHVAYLDASRGACWEVNLIIASTIVTDELQGRRQDGDQLGVYAACGVIRLEGAVGDCAAVEGTGPGFCEEGGAGGGVGDDYVGDLADGRPGIMSAVGCWLVWRTYSGERG